MKTKILFITSLLLIVGCSKPVEDSTLINKDGLMYLPDSDSPYSGEVFTNYDTGEKEYQGTYENGLLIQYSFLNKDGTVKVPINVNTLIEREGVVYTSDTNKPYSGPGFYLDKDYNRKLFEYILKKGKIISETRLEYHFNGQKESEKTFKDGIRYSFKMWYENGQEIFGDSSDWKEDGLLTWYTWYESGEKAMEGTSKNRKLMYYLLLGEKIQLENYNDGDGDGFITGWYKNGKKMSEENYKDGKIISSKCWDEDGNEKECY